MSGDNPYALLEGSVEHIALSSDEDTITAASNLPPLTTLARWYIGYCAAALIALAFVSWCVFALLD